MELKPGLETNAELVRGIYRTRDDISNFKLRIRVRKAMNGEFQNSQSLTQGSTESVRSSSSSGELPDHKLDLLDEVIVGWQQKVFNQSEVNFYKSKSEESFNNDILGRKFYHDVQKLGADGKGHLIYTVLDGELINPTDDEEDKDENKPKNEIQYEPLTTDPHEEPHVLSQLMMDGLRRRRIQGTESGACVSDITTVPSTNIVVQEPSQELRQRLHTTTFQWQLMSVRLDLSQLQNDQEVTVVNGSSSKKRPQFLELCFIQYGSNGILEVIPDFSSSRPYRMETLDSQSFDVWLDHVSPSMHYHERLREATMVNEVLAKLAQQRHAHIGDDFAIVPKRTFRLMLNGEIVSADNFDYDGLLVHFFVELPLGWSATDESQLCGMTQTCFTTANSNGIDVAYFSHAFNADLLYDLNRMDLEGDTTMPKWPQCFFEVISVDSWSRCRTEGYGFTSIPHNAGSYDLVLSTWRPIVARPSCEMRRYFVGGTPELDDLSYAGTPGNVSSHEPLLSRYGLRTVSSGSVRIRLNVVHQSRAFLGNPDDDDKPYRSLIDRISSATLFSSVSQVMEAFERARERLARITREYEVNLEQGSKKKK